MAESNSQPNNSAFTVEDVLYGDESGLLSGIRWPSNELRQAVVPIVAALCELRDLHAVHLQAQAKAIAGAEHRLAEAERLLQECRKGFDQLPHSYGFTYTHIEKINKFFSSDANKAQAAEGKT